MRKLQLLFVLLVNIIVLTSCTDETETKDVTVVQKATSTAAAAASSSSNDGASAAAAASAKATAVVKTTENSDDSEKDVTKTKNVTIVQKATSAAAATSSSSNDGASAAAAASAKATAVVIKTTKTTENNDNFGNGSTDAGNSGNTYDECSGDDLNNARSAIAKLGFQYLHGLLTSNCGAKVCSPLGAYYEMSFVGISAKKYSAAYNRTLEFACLPSDYKIRCVLRLIGTFLDDKLDGVSYKYSANIVSKLTNPFSKSFKCEAKKTLYGTARNCDFNRPKLVQRMLNNYVAEETGGCVENTVPCSEPFTKNCTGTKLVIVSGRIFEALWQRDFEPAGKGNYTDMDNKTREVDGVMQCDTYNYVDSKELNAKVLQVNYKNSFFVLRFFYPNEGVSVSVYTNLLKKLQNETLYNQVITSCKKTPLKLYLPVYSDDMSVFNYVDIFKKEDIMTPLFDAGTSSIVNACTGKSRNEYISSAYTKTIIKSSLRGVEPNNCSDSSYGDITALRLGRPVIYTISRNGITLATGIGNVE